MNGKLITFDELRSRQEIDIVGGYIEIHYEGRILRGIIDDIFWWHNHSPRQIIWTDGLTLATPTCTNWKKSQGGKIRFTYEMIETFSGPFEDELGPIFFTLRGVADIVIYPVNCSPPEKPQDLELFKALLRCIS